MSRVVICWVFMFCVNFDFFFFGGDCKCLKFFGIFGSLCWVLFNIVLLYVVVELLLVGYMLVIYDLYYLLLFDQDVEEQGDLVVVVVLKDVIVVVDVLLLVLFEYNGGIIGVLKNVIDWVLCKGMVCQVVLLVGKCVCIIGVSFGIIGIVCVQDVLWLVLCCVGVIVELQGEVLVFQVYIKIVEGKLVDECICEVLVCYLQNFIVLVECVF